MDRNHGLSPARNPGSSAGGMPDDGISDTVAASLQARCERQFRPTAEQASRVAQNIDKGNSGKIETEPTNSKTEHETMRQQRESKQEGLGQFISEHPKHSQEAEENHNKGLNDFRGHGNGERYNKEHATRAKTMKRKIDDTEEQNGSTARSLPVSDVRLSPSRAMHEKEEGQKEAYFNTPETADADRIRNLEADNKRLKSEKAELERKLDETRTELFGELSELRSENYFSPTKYADSEIRKDWSQLGFLIEQFASNHFPNMLRLEDFQQAEEPEQYSHVGEVCVEAASVLQSGHIYPYLVESMVWRFINKEIFDSESKLWAGDIGKKFDNICGKIIGKLIRPGKMSEYHSSFSFDESTRRSLLGCVKKLHGSKKTKLFTAYHEWRSRSVSFFVDLGMEKKPKDTSTATEMMYELRPFMSARVSRRRFPQEIIADATEIINKAVDINIELRKSKADFNVIFSGAVRSKHHRSFGYDFDIGTMDKISLLPSSNQPGQASPPIVDMAVSPGLIKCGNSDGTNYESKKVLAKMRVVCDLDAFFNDVDDEEDDEDVDNDGESATSGHPTITPQNPAGNEGVSDVSSATAPEYANNSKGPDSQPTDRPLAQNGDHEKKEQMNESTIIVAEHASTTVEHEEQEGGACDVAKSKRNSPERSPLTGEGEVLKAVMVHPQVEEAEESPEAMDLDGMPTPSTYRRVRRLTMKETCKWDQIKSDSAQNRTRNSHLTPFLLAGHEFILIFWSNALLR